MSTTALRPVPAQPAGTGAVNGGAPARRAVICRAWRLFRREWRHQLLVLALLALLAGREPAMIARQPLESDQIRLS